ncbi:MAG: NAD(P)-dependent alcohol dehydrogenase [Acidimicrobiia bacterium]
MKAIVHSEYGSPDVLRLQEVDPPGVGDDQVLVKVRAASVNPLDWHYMRGLPRLVRLQTGLGRPKRQRRGADMSGVVEAVGRDVSRFQPGDEVFGEVAGSLAEYVAASEHALAIKPVGISFQAAAAVPVAGLTALQGLRDKARLRPGQRVLVNGASGGVGTCATQIAKALGAQVTGVTSTRNLEMVRSIGADEVIDYTRDDFTATDRRYDVIFDTVFTKTLSAYRRVLKPDGVYVAVGAVEMGDWIGPIVHLAKVAVGSLIGSPRMVPMLAQARREDLETLAGWMASGELAPVIDRVYTLAEVPEAIRYLEEGHARGKVVITV